MRYVQHISGKSQGRPPQKALRGWSAEQRKPNLLRDSISQLQLHHGSPRKVTIFFCKSLKQEQICMRKFHIRSYQKFLRVAPQAPALARQMSGGHGGQRSERAFSLSQKSLARKYTGVLEYS